MKQPSADVGAASYPEYKTKLLQSHDKTWTDSSCFLWRSKESGFLRWNLFWVKNVEMTTKDSEYYINWVDKAVAEPKRLDSNSEKILLWVKRHQTAEHAAEKLFMKGRVNWCGKFPHCLTLRNCHSHPNLQQPLLCSVSSLQHQRKALLYQQKITVPWKLRWWLAFFSNEVFFN